jgi:prepilin-type N-terminal cleavage/methylation domain-containing protein
MTSNKQRGFTIIEVALVLAVAALIFLVVFLAVPALQRNQRNDAIKRDISAVVTAVTTYTSNNNTTPADGTIATTDTTPTGTPADLLKYIDKTSNNVTTIKVEGSAGTYVYAAPTKGTIKVIAGYKCGSAPAVAPTTTNATARSIAVVGVVELSGTNTETYCQDAN